MSGLYETLDIKANTDKRGAVLFPFRDLTIDPADVINLHAATINKGGIRGNHSHPNHAEYIIIMGPDVKIRFVSPGGQSAEKITGDEPVCLKIYPGVAHALLNLGEPACFIVCWHIGPAGEVGTESKVVIE